MPLETLPNGLKYDSDAGVLLCPPSRLRPDPHQPRKTFDRDSLAALQADIEAWRKQGRGVAGTGLLQPILARWEAGAVTRSGQVKAGAKLDIIDGERRWRACKGLPMVAVVLDDVGATDAHDAALRSNIHRDKLLPIEEAHALAQKQKQAGLSNRALAKHFSLSQGYVDNRLALVAMPTDVQAMANERPDTISSAREIAKLTDKHDRAPLIREVLAGASYKYVQGQVESQLQRKAGRVAAQKPPDAQTASRQAAHKTGGGQMSRGRQVKSNTAIDAREQTEAAIAQIKSWHDYLSDADHKRLLVRFAQEIVHGTLRR